MSLESMLSGFGGLVGTAVMNKKNREATERARKRSFDTINSLDWEPMYATETTPQYQKTQSPVARSFLESFIAGNNPSSTFSGAPNAQMVKAGQQRAQNQMFGTMQDRMAKSQALQTQNPYQVQTPTRPVMGKQAAEATWAGANPGAQSAGLTSDEHQKLVQMGVLKEGEDLPNGGFAVSSPEAFTRALKGAIAAGDSDALNRILRPTLDRPHAIARNRQRRKAEERTRKAIDKYDGEG